MWVIALLHGHNLELYSPEVAAHHLSFVASNFHSLNTCPIAHEGTQSCLLSLFKVVSTGPTPRKWGRGFAWALDSPPKGQNFTLPLGTSPLNWFPSPSSTGLSEYFSSRASRVENRGCNRRRYSWNLADPKEVRAGIREIHFLPFNLTDKRIALTYIDSEGKMHRVDKWCTGQVNSPLPTLFIFGDQLAIAKETGCRLGMGTNMYPSSALLGQNKDESIAALPIDDLIEKSRWFSLVSSLHKYEIVKCLQARKHICGMTGDGVNDAPILKKADTDSTDAARSASDIVLTEPGLSVIISVVLTNICSFHHNSYCGKLPSSLRVIHLHHLSTFGFMLLALLWKFDFPPFMVLIIAILCHVLKIEHFQMDWRNGILGKAQQERLFLVDLLSFIRNYVSLHDQ
ncbi:hypothetical protein IFM89_009085 [Coptis chinensis]|uniref:Uncharacterized protein n=1 Tax=Coptis chinensis TaxID=261450 RepID=A0A835INE4_9MAGN|nr:hypothetical protein IFM89_009085 [Coptis chinensis]